MSFADKVVLVTGGTSGIGRETAVQFARAGAKVVIAGRRKAEGEAVVAEIKSAGGTALFVQTDVTSEDQVRNLVEQTVSEFGHLDIAFNNAGVEHGGPAHEISETSCRIDLEETASDFRTGGGVSGDFLIDHGRRFSVLGAVV